MSSDTDQRAGDASATGDLAGRSSLALLAAMHYADSAYPAGGFAHSWGLESGAALGAIVTADHLLAVCRAALTHQTARTDAVAAAAACRAAVIHGLDRLAAVDRRLSATRAAREPREAARSTGRRLLTTAAAMERHPFLDQLQAAVHAGESPGNHAVVLGAIAGCTGLSDQDAAALALWSALNGMVNAALRLLRISHLDGQRVLTALRPPCAALAARAAATDPALLAGTAPMLEIWAMQHETARTRLFAS